MPSSIFPPHLYHTGSVVFLNNTLVIYRCACQSGTSFGRDVQEDRDHSTVWGESYHPNVDWSISNNNFASAVFFFFRRTVVMDASGDEKPTLKCHEFSISAAWLSSSSSSAHSRYCTAQFEEVVPHLSITFQIIL